MNNISAWSIRNPVPTLVLFVLLTLAGLMSLAGMRINNTPDVEVPIVSVSIAQPGAAPRDLEVEVARLVENAVFGLSQVKSISSTVNDGGSNTAVEFELGIDPDVAVNNVRNAVARIRAELPADVTEPVVSRNETIGGAFATYAVDAPGMAVEDLSWFIDDTVARTLIAVPGVGAVQRTGGVAREVTVSLDPSKLRAYGVTVDAISRALRAAAEDRPGGRVTLRGDEQTIRVVAAPGSVAELEDVRVPGPGGRAWRLGDLATVTDGPAEARSMALLDGSETVAFGVLRATGSGEVQVADRVETAVAQLRKAYPDMTFTKVASTASFVTASYWASVEALAFGALLAIAVVWLFLRDWRATAISGLAMPLSLLPTFFVMALFDQSLNVVTLLALSLMVGVLVDDAIVEVENITRHIREGKPPFEAALEAADEIGLAVVATTLVLVAVFAPTGFLPGVVGQFFRAFAIGTCTSVLFSLLVARMLTPMMAAYLMRAPKRPTEDKPFWMDAYLRLLERALANRWKMLALSLAIFIGFMSLTRLLPSDFVPAADRAMSVASLELDPGATLAQTEAATRLATQILQERPEVTSVYAAIGAATAAFNPQGGGAAGEVRRAVLTVNLVDKYERKLSQRAFEQDVSPALAEIPGAKVRFGADGSAGTKVAFTLVSTDGAALERSVNAMIAGMNAIDGLGEATSSLLLVRPELTVRIDPYRAGLAGVSADAIARTIRVATQGDADVALPKFNLADRQIPIRVRLSQASRDDEQTLRDLVIPKDGGGGVRLEEVADIAFVTGPSVITRLNRARSATVEAELGDLTLGEALTKIRALPAFTSLPANVREETTGEARNLAELSAGFVVAIGAGILIMYFLLVLLFGSFGQPLTILFALPLSVGGAFGLLFIAGKALSMPAIIGLIMLLGLAAKNSILLVEYAILAIRDGVDRTHALLQAARKRSRPIIMTTLAMGLGMAPIALELGYDTEFRSPMAIGVIGGLITSTLLSLIFIPVIYTLVDDAEHAIGRFASRFIRFNKPMDAPPTP